MAEEGNFPSFKTAVARQVKNAISNNINKRVNRALSPIAPFTSRAQESAGFGAPKSFAGRIGVGLLMKATSLKGPRSYEASDFSQDATLRDVVTAIREFKILQK